MTKLNGKLSLFHNKRRVALFADANLAGFDELSKYTLLYMSNTFPQQFMGHILNEMYLMG